MTTKSSGQYRIIKNRNVPIEEQVSVLAKVPRSRVDERLASLVASGRVAMSAVVAKYHELVRHSAGDE
jgi:hypothetical protein